MTTSAETGRELEQRIAAYFQSHGYSVRCNAILEGRSGGRHEIDVLAEKSDPLTTFRVAVECKAWQQPIEKDVVSKLHYILGDLGLSKGMIVALAGARSGADRTAADLGIDLWGPDELRHHLGEQVLGSLGVAPGAANSSVTWGHPFAVAPDAARQLIEASGKGRLGMRTLEPLRWFSPLWLPAYAVELTVAQPETKRLTTRVHSSTVHGLYDALDGTYLGRTNRAWEQVDVDERIGLPPMLRDTKLNGALTKAFADYAKVTSATAVERHTAKLGGLGIPTPCTALTVDRVAAVHLPFFVGILESDGRQRVLAVRGQTGEVSTRVSQLLTAHLAHVRAHFTPG